MATQSVPGTAVPTGAAISPAGGFGPQGPTGPTGPQGVSGDAGNIATIGSDSLVLVPQSALWNMRLRSFNAVGNPNFEVDQRNVFSGVTNIANNAFSQDRWQVITTGTMRASTQANQGQTSAVIPGTSFLITQAQLNTTVTTTEPTLAAGDYWVIQQTVEGPLWRELSNDVSSISILCYSSIALSFSISLRSANSGLSLVKLCTVSTPNQWTLIPLPNIPKPTSGTFNLTPGNVGYTLGICLACGSTFTAPAANTWQNGNFLGAPGMSNLFATSGAVFILAFIQHEPGPQCTQLIDKPFSQNYDECLRYYCKSYSYGIAPGVVNSFGCPTAYILAGGHPYIPVFYKKTMAKSPTVTGYSNLNGASNTVYDNTGAANKVITATANASDSGFQGFSVTGPNAGNWLASFHYTADTGW